MDALSTLLNNVHLYETKFYCVKADGEWSYSFTRKDVVVFYMLIDGSLCLDTVDNQREILKNEIVMLPANHNHLVRACAVNGKNSKPIEPLLETGHKLQINVKDKNYNAHFILIEAKYDAEVTLPLFNALPTILPGDSSQSQFSGEFLQISIEILKMASSGEGMGKAALVNRLACIIMIECLRLYIKTLPEATSSWLRALKDPYLAKALTVMHNKPDVYWTIDKLAQVAGMSRSSFAERFKNIVGVPPLTYLIDYRMRLAARYLKMPQYSMSQISELVGYASHSTFSQAFKRVYGVSPRGYRQQLVDDDEVGTMLEAN